MRLPTPNLFTSVGIVLPDHVAPRRPRASSVRVSSDPAPGADRPDAHGSAAEVPDAVSRVPRDERRRALGTAGDRDG
jgi:hypothetical protein